ncbi:hypothetical protein LOSG293_011310 [Secundilactobacillus oryzae JCM 18671]|uniref:Uncharacterized protein n=1 Tax=Secundilactobacillus oryzae JCM 18671 TaxID=1291743 RepID=A0A081BG63_9LACO|nr:hypothetical protein [Secundilactobacillus oryzae]GAK47031.1 hypothetical protein LOSG293_011310 [Secundilactobacillus oryzae JCM 18671]
MVNDNHVQTAEAATKKKQTVYLGKVKKARVIYRFDLKKNTAKKYGTVNKGQYVAATYNKSLGGWIITIYKSKKVKTTSKVIFAVSGKSATWFKKVKTYKV